jgi:tRNA threonylcarbamoyladenosine biosynthesis protein TsaB
MKARPDAAPVFDIALETSTRRASLAIGHEDRIQVEYLADNVAHASDLLPLLSTRLERMGLELKHLRSIHVGIGPGSFTGLRVGCTIALGLAEGLHTPLCAVPSVAATAWANLQDGELGTVVLDARGGALYLATYRKQADGLLVVGPPMRCKLAAAKELDLPEGCLLGDPKALALLHGEERSSHPWRVDAEPDAGALLKLGLRKMEREGATPPEQVRPLYLAEFGA